MEHSFTPSLCNQIYTDWCYNNTQSSIPIPSPLPPPLSQISLSPVRLNQSLSRDDDFTLSYITDGIVEIRYISLCNVFRMNAISCGSTHKLNSRLVVLQQELATHEEKATRLWQLAHSIYFELHTKSHNYFNLIMDNDLTLLIDELGFCMDGKLKILTQKYVPKIQSPI